MFAISFDLIVPNSTNPIPNGQSRLRRGAQNPQPKRLHLETRQRVHHPEGGLAELFTAVENLKALPWFPAAVRELRAFRLENNSDLTSFLKT